MLALIAGRGTLPAEVAAAQGEPPLICALAGYAPEGLAPDITFRLEHLGSFLIELGERGISEVCFVGAIDRPTLDPAALDAETAPLLAILKDALVAGDDAALRAIIALFEQTGFTVRGAHELAPDLVAPPGVLSETWPDAQMRADAARGAAVLAALAPLDVGQACVVGAGQVWGIEAAGGTDHLLATLPQAAREANAVLVKGPKSGQDLRADMPTVGPGSIDAILDAGLAGLVIDAGRVILLDQETTVRRANAMGLVLWSRTTD